MPQAEDQSPVAIVKAFMMYSGQLPPVVLVAVEGKQQWRRDVLPAMKRAAAEIAGHNVPWDELGVTGIEGGDSDNYPIEFFTKSMAAGRYTRVIIHPDKTYTIFHPTTA